MLTRRTLSAAVCLFLAWDLVSQCAEATADNPPAHAVELQQGSRLRKQAQAKTAEAEEQSAAPKKSARLKVEARALLMQAQDAFASALASVQKARQKQDTRALESAYVQLRLLDGMTTQEIANTFAEKDAERVKTMKQAIAKFQLLQREYERVLVSMVAMLYEAECRHDLGDVKKALPIFAELLDLPKAPAFDDLKKRAIQRAMAIWIDQGRPGDYDNALLEGTRWLNELTEYSDDNPDALAVHFFLAKAFTARATTLKEKAKKHESLRQAASNAQFVAKHSKQHARAAKELLQRLPAGIVAEFKAGERPNIAAISLFPQIND